MGLDYYAILNIRRDCAPHDIALAYRKYATVAHPLRKPYPQHPENPPEGCPDASVVGHLPALPPAANWQLINEAYDVLVNPLHREVFDQYGEEGLKRGTPTPNGYVQPYVYHGDHMKTYKDTMGTVSPYADLIEAATNPPPLYNINGVVGVCHKADPVEMPIYVSLKDVYFGGVKKTLFLRHEFTDASQTCTEKRECVFTIPIRPGIATGSRITFPDAGDRGPCKRPADIVFVVTDRPDPIYRRDGIDLHWTYEVDLQQSLCGFVIDVQTVDGRRFWVPVANVVRPGEVKCIADEGLPAEWDPDVKGNLYIRFEVKFPEVMSLGSRRGVAVALKSSKYNNEILRCSNKP